MPKRHRVRDLGRAIAGTPRSTAQPELFVVTDARPAVPLKQRLRERVATWFTGLSFYVAGSCVCLLLASLGFLGVRQSSGDMLLWSGTKVAATEQHAGVAFYTWNHRQHTLDVPGYATKSHLTVYLDPAHPDFAVTDSLATRILDGMLTVVPAALAVLIMVVGVVRRRIARRNSTSYLGGYGRGLDPEVVDRLLAERRTRS